MSEPQPGRPGGGGNSGPRSATAATFMVNDSTLRELRRTWQGLTQDVKNFGAAVGDLKRHERDLERLGAKLSALGVGGVGGAGGRPGRGTGGRAAGMPPAPIDYTHPDRGGGRAAGMPPVPAAPGPVDIGMPGIGRPPGHVDNMGSTPPPGSGGGPVGGSDGRAPNGGDFSFGKAAKVAGGAALAGMGLAANYYQQRMGPISDNDLMMNQLAQASGGGGYSRDKFTAQQKALVGGGDGAVGIGGYQSMEDLNKGVSTVTRSVGGTATTGRGAQVLKQAGSLAGLTPDAGLAGSSQALAGVYTAQSSRRLQAVTGTSSIGVGGKLAGGTQVYDNILRSTFGTQKLTMAMITEGMVPGAPLQRNLDYLIPDPNTQEQFRQYAIAKVNLGGSSARVNAALESVKLGKKTADTKRSGLDDTIRSQQNRAGGASTRAATEAGVAGKDGLQEGFEDLTRITDTLTDSFRHLNESSGGQVGDAAGYNAVLGGKQIQGALGAVGGIGGGLFAASQARDWLSRRRGGTGGGPGGGGGGGGGGSGDPGGGVQRVFVVNQCCDGVGGAGSGDGTDVAGGDVDGDGKDKDGKGKDKKKGRIGRLGARVGAGASAVGGGTIAAVVGGTALAGVGAKGALHASSDEGREQRDRIEAEQKRRGERGALSGVNSWFKSAFHGGLGSVPLIGGGIRSALGTNKLPEAGLPTPGAYEPAQRYGYNSHYDNSSAPRMAHGGEVAGNHTRDDVGIRATPGELVVPLPVVGRHGGASRLMQMLGFSAGNKVGGADGSGYAFGGEVTGKVSGLNPEFLRRLKAWSASVGEPYNVGSGYRDIAQQKTLYDRWIRRVPGQAPAAKPGSSNHNFGLASDGSRWSKKNPGAFGLVYPMSYEPWHVEPVGAKGMRTGAPATPGEAEAAGGKAAQPANGVGGSPVVAGPTWASRSTAYTSELEALASVLGGGGLGAAVKSQSSGRGVAATEPNVAGGAAGGAGGAAASSAPSNPSGNVKLGQQKAAARGWTGGEWDALYNLWQKESGWRTNAANPTSSARGIPQAMMTAHYGKNWESNPEAKMFLTDPSKQIDWGLNYIAGRYKTPSKAWAHSQKTNWYEKGAYDVIGDEMAQLHSGEMVVPRGAATKLRSMIASGRSTSGNSGQPSQEGTRSTVTLTIQAPVTVVGKATPDDARKFLEMVRDEANDEIERNTMLENAGMG